MRSLLAVALVFGLATPSVAGADCAARVQQLKQKLSQLKPAPTLLVPASFATEAPHTSVGSPVRESGPVIGYSGATFSMDGALRSPDALAAALKRAKPKILYIAAGSALPAQKLSEIAAMAPSAELRVLLMPMQDEKQAAKLYEDLAAAQGTCRPLRNAFADAERVLPEKKWPLLREKAPAALKECRCEGADPEKLAATLAKLNDPLNQPFRYQVIKVGAKGRDLKLSPSASLGQLLDALWALPPAERSKPVKLVQP